MRRLLFGSLACLTLIGCSSLQTGTGLAPAAEPSATATPPYPSILNVFPMRVGAAWAYRVSLDTTENGQPIHWSGTITETITAVTQSGRAWIFDAEIQGHPLYGNSPARLPHYVAFGNRLYKLSGNESPTSLVAGFENGARGVEFVSWPLGLSQQWGEPQYLARGDGRYVWRVETRESVETPAGHFKDCYGLLFLTNPDDTRIWFCPGVGVARYEYHHHGSVLDDLRVLQKFNAGK